MKVFHLLPLIILAGCAHPTVSHQREFMASLEVMHRAAEYQSQGDAPHDAWRHARSRPAIDSNAGPDGGIVPPGPTHRWFAGAGCCW